MPYPIAPAHVQAGPHDDWQNDDVPLVRTVATVMITDIEDSTSLARSVGVAAIAKYLRQHFALGNQVVAARGGTVVCTTGDGILAFWGGPAMRAGEAARLALSAAADLAKAIAWANSARRFANQPVRRIRIGLHSGELAIVGSQDDRNAPQIYGVTAHDARRVEQAGKMVSTDDTDVVVMASQATLMLAGCGPEITGPVYSVPLCRAEGSAPAAAPGCRARPLPADTCPMLVDPVAIASGMLHEHPRQACI